MNPAMCIALCGTISLCACDKDENKMQNGTPSETMTASSMTAHADAGTMMGATTSQPGMMGSAMPPSMVMGTAPANSMGAMAPTANSGMGGASMGGPMGSARMAPAASAKPAMSGHM